MPIPFDLSEQVAQLVASALSKGVQNTEISGVLLGAALALLDDGKGRLNDQFVAAFMKSSTFVGNG